MGILEMTFNTENFVGVNAWTILFAWINLIILYLFLKKLLFVPIKNMIDARQKEIDDMYDDSESERESAEAMRSEYEARMQSAKEESEEIVKSAVRRARLKEEEILREADKTAEAKLRRAEELAELERRRIVNEAKNEVSELAVGIASAIIERDVTEGEHKALIDDFINGMGGEDD